MSDLVGNPEDRFSRVAAHIVNRKPKQTMSHQLVDTIELQLSRLMGKPTICIGENKDADQLRGNREADHAFVFATRIVQFLFYLNPKLQASNSFLCLYRLVCVRPVQKPHCWFSHEAAQLILRLFSEGS